MSPAEFLTAAGGILGVMTVLTAIETLLPLRAGGPWSRRHRVPNLALTLITMASYAMGNAAVALLATWQADRGIGLLPALSLPSPLATGLAIVALDLATYGAHALMHAVPALWRFHRVHHADPMIDVTTTLRQHPGESVVRLTVLAAAVFATGASPGAIVIYRSWSALNGLLEHANVRIPRRLDAVVARVLVTPHMHKVHHSRHRHETNTNYGNILSVFDRLFRTFTPSARGLRIDYGLAGFDDPRAQTTAALLALPFRPSMALASAARPARPAAARSTSSTSATSGLGAGATRGAGRSGSSR
jgi:sterol desaturase/sphingolipid hydroxylase (fatty acid hydroxylase superfamily)